MRKIPSLGVTFGHLFINRITSGFLYHTTVLSSSSVEVINHTHIYFRAS
jgi:hypothetical protein